MAAHIVSHDSDTHIGGGSFEQCKLILKWYWKLENVLEVQRWWIHESETTPST
jgi:hypothetical protein